MSSSGFAGSSRCARLEDGVGDKLLLRHAARRLGLHHSAALPKRAVQFGCGLAGHTNIHHFGSNRKAKQQHAGARRSPFACRLAEPGAEPSGAGGSDQREQWVVQIGPSPGFAGGGHFLRIERGARS